MFNSITDLILIGILVFSGIFLIFFTIKYIINFINQKEFENEYSIKLGNGFKVHKNNPSINRYELAYPKWKYSNKDGSQNKVRNNNSLIYYYSILYFNGFILKTKSPIQMIYLVKKIRDKYGDYTIEKNSQELNKYIELQRKKDLFNKANKSQVIIDEFSDNPTEFETFCAELFKKMGYKTEVTSRTNDGGFDIILKKHFEKSIVECKCYAQDHTIGRPMIQKLVGANQKVKADNMKFITTSKFSKEAILFANETDVELIDGRKLVELINRFYQKTPKITISRNEWELNYSDLKKLCPPDIDF